MSKGSKSRGRGLPAWYARTGKLVLDDIDGTWEGERSGKLFKQRGLNVTKKNLEFVTDAERIEMLNRRMG